MALIVLLRGINVGGHRSFRPKLLAQELDAFGVVNIGAAGTFVVRQPGSRARLRDELRTRLPDATRFVLCEGHELLRLESGGALGQPPRAGLVGFVSFLERAPRTRPALPLTIPEGGEWFVRVTALANRLVVGEYRRHMKTIGHLAQLDAVFGTVATTRSWNTVNTILQVLKNDHEPRRAAR